MHGETVVHEFGRPRETAIQSRRRRRAGRAASVVLAAAAATAGGCYYMDAQAYESTDDAFIDGSVIQMSPRVGGQVVRVHVQDNQHVRKGDLIAEIDTLASQEPAPQDAGAIRQADARIGQIEARRASAQAELSPSYVRIYAPDSGYITRKAVGPGDFVQPGQALLALVSDRLWVVASFKETQLRHMRAGQPVTLRLDAYPQLRLKGHVECSESETGAGFSRMPAGNTTGNHANLVQRLPVKIALDEAPAPEYRIGPGMPVETTVKVK